MNTSIQDLLKKSIDSESGFRSISETLANYVADTKKQIKLQKPIVDYIKVVIKSKKHSSLQKVYALKLLHKCIGKQNLEFNRYVEKKFLKRLTIFAEHKPSIDLLTRGENIFLSDEKDKRNACAFLILLLDFIEKWSQILPLADDLKSPSQFAKSYQSLIAKKITFPSQVNNQRIQEIISDFSSLKVAVNQSTAFQVQAHRSQSSHQSRQGSNGNATSKQQNLKVAEELKQKMFQTKEISKKSEQFLAKLERTGFQCESHEMLEMSLLFESGKEYCEISIQQLTSEQIMNLVANSDQLLEKMLKFQEQILTAISIIQPYSESIKQSETEAYQKIQKQYQSSQKNSAPKQAELTLQPQASQKRNNSVRGNDLLSQLGTVDFNFQNQQNKNDQKEKNDDDLWNNLEQFATQFNDDVKNSQQPQSTSNMFSQQPKLEPKLHLFAQNDTDPFAEAVQENLSRQREQEEQKALGNGNQNDDDFFSGFNQSNQNPQTLVNQQDQNYDFGFRQQQQQDYGQQKNQIDQQYPNYKDYQQDCNNYDQNQQDSNYYQKQEYNVSPEMEMKFKEETEEEEVKEEDQPVVGLKLWEQSLDDFKTNNSNQKQDQQQQQQYNQYQEQNQVALVDNTVYMQQELGYMRKQNQDLIQENHILKNQIEYNQHINDSYNELHERYTYLQSQFDTQKKYYQDQIYERDRIIQQKQLEVDELNRALKDFRDKNSSQDQNQFQSRSLSQNQQKSQSFHVSQSQIIKSFPENQQIDNYPSARSDSSNDDHSQIESQMNKLNLKQVNSIEKLKESYEETSYQSNQQVENNQKAYNSQELASDSVSSSNSQKKSPSSGEHKKSTQGSLQKSLDNFYFRALFSDKCVIYEDVNIQLGCIRQISAEWRQAAFKIYLGNKSETTSISDLSIKSESSLISIKGADTLEQILQPKGQREIQILASGSFTEPAFIFLSYQMGEKNSGQLQIKLPVNPLFFCESFSVKTNDFKSLWSFNKCKKEQYFNMDLSRAANIQQLKQVVTLNEKHGAFIQGVDEKPNIVAFASRHLDGQILIKVEVSPNGKNCKLEVSTDYAENIIQSIVDTVTDLIGQK